MMVTFHTYDMQTNTERYIISTFSMTGNVLIYHGTSGNSKGNVKNMTPIAKTFGKKTLKKYQPPVEVPKVTSASKIQTKIHPTKVTPTRESVNFAPKK